MSGLWTLNCMSRSHFQKKRIQDLSNMKSRLAKRSCAPSHYWFHHVFLTGSLCGTFFFQAPRAQQPYWPRVHEKAKFTMLAVPKLTNFVHPIYCCPGSTLLSWLGKSHRLNQITRGQKPHSGIVWDNHTYQAYSSSPKKSKLFLQEMHCTSIAEKITVQ